MPPTVRFRRGLVPLSADPITAGHLDLLKRSASECAELIVAVMDNDLKRGSYAFSLMERSDMAARAIREVGITNARVQIDAGLLTDLYLREDCDAVFRGVRDEVDRQYEERQMRVNGSILPGIEERVVYLNADPKLDLVSSSVVKAMVMRHVDVSALGDSFLMERSFTAASASEVAKQFGEKFAAKLGELSPGKWEGPVESGYGAHLVFVSERTEGRVPELAEVREDVRREWANAQRLELNEKFYQELSKRYSVTIENPLLAKVQP